MLLPSSQCETHSPGSLVHAEGPAGPAAGDGCGGRGKGGEEGPREAGGRQPSPLLL